MAEKIETPLTICMRELRDAVLREPRPTSAQQCTERLMECYRDLERRGVVVSAEELAADDVAALFDHTA